MTYSIKITQKELKVCKYYNDQILKRTRLSSVFYFGLKTALTFTKLLAESLVHRS